MNNMGIKKSLHSPVFSYRHKLIRLFWGGIYLFFFKYSPVPFFSYRRSLLRLFGAKLSSKTHIYPSAKIWFPLNLAMARGATIGPNVIIYNQGNINIGINSIVSQGAHLCASTHDYNDPLHPLILSPITIGNNVWVCADAFVGPGVILAEGCVIGARAVVNKNTKNWTVYTGNPAVIVNKREPFQ